MILVLTTYQVKHKNNRKQKSLRDSIFSKISQRKS